VLAQISSVQDGSFHDPATWSCNCVPQISDEIIIGHTVHSTEHLNLGESAVITPSGTLMVNSGNEFFPAVYSNTSLDIQGSLYMNRALTTFGTLSLSGILSCGSFIEVAGILNMEGGDLTATQLNIGTGQMYGSGTLCIEGCSVYGMITAAQVDVCGPTPPEPGDPPCSGSGFVAGLIWCSIGVECVVPLTIPIIPSHVVTAMISDRSLIVTTATAVSTSWSIVDALGRIHQTGKVILQPGGQETISLAALSNGAYSLVFADTNIRSTRFVLN
jgi:hypothetical protein